MPRSKNTLVTKPGSMPSRSFVGWVLPHPPFPSTRKLRSGLVLRSRCHPISCRGWPRFSEPRAQPRSFDERRPCFTLLAAAPPRFGEPGPPATVSSSGCQCSAPCITYGAQSSTPLSRCDGGAGPRQLTGGVRRNRKFQKRTEFEGCLGIVSSWENLFAAAPAQGVCF